MMKSHWLMAAAAAAVLFSYACAADNQTACEAQPQKVTATDPTPDDKPLPPADTLEGVLARLHRKTQTIDTYQAKLNYLFIQEPELLDARTLRTGTLYYKKDADPKDDKGALLRLNFDTIKQDQGKVRKQLERYFFNGVWLVRVDYPLEKVERHQQAPEGKPVDVFRFISQNFPVIGFTQVDQLKQDFEITLDEAALKSPDKPILLKLKVRDGSRFQDKYTSIDFYIEKKTFLPSRIVTTSTEEDIYDISFLEPKLNQKLENDIFTVEVPSHFSTIVHPLEEAQGGTEAEKD